MEKYIKTHICTTKYLGVRYNKKSFIIETEGITYNLLICKKDNASKKRKVNIYAISQWCTDYIREYMNSKGTECTLKLDDIISLVRIKYGMELHVIEYKKEGVIA